MRVLHVFGRERVLQEEVREGAGCLVASPGPLSRACATAEWRSARCQRIHGGHLARTLDVALWAAQRIHRWRCVRPPKGLRFHVSLASTAVRGCVDFHDTIGGLSGEPARRCATHAATSMAGCGGAATAIDNRLVCCLMRLPPVPPFGSEAVPSLAALPAVLIGPVTGTAWSR